jgi:hypothetical protein
MKRMLCYSLAILAAAVLVSGCPGGGPSKPKITVSLVSATFADTNNNRGIDAGDRVTLTFSRAVRLTSSAVSKNVTNANFTIPVTGDTIGTGATLVDTVTGDANIELVLGTGPALTIAGVFSNATVTTGSPSGIGIPDWAAADLVEAITGHKPKATAPVDIQGAFTPDTTGPALLSAQFFDNNSNSYMDGADYILLIFDENVIVGNGSLTPVAVGSSDFDFPVSGDSLGAGPTIMRHPTSATNVYLWVGTGATLIINGSYSAANLTAGSPSGINIGLSITPGLITDDSLAKNNAQHLDDALDIQGNFVTDVTGPYITAMVFVDNNNDAAINQGDYINIQFNENVQLPGGADNLAVTDAQLFWPISGNTLGGGGALLMDLNKNNPVIALVIQDNAAHFVVAGAYNAANLSATDPSGFAFACSSIIVDTAYFHNAVKTTSNASEAVDIGGTFVEDTTGPKLTLAYFNDLDNTLMLTFDENVTVAGNSAALTLSTHYGMPVTNDTLGTSATAHNHGTNAKKVLVNLGADFVLTAPGIYNSAVTTAGSPSGFYFIDTTGAITDVSGHHNPATGVIGDALDVVGRYIEVDTLQNAAAMHYQRIDHGVVTLADGRVLVCGGETATLNASTFVAITETYLRTAEIYDPVAGTWTDTGNMTVARAGHSATLLPDNTVLITGGLNVTGADFLNSCEIFNPGSGLFTPLDNQLQIPRYRHRAFLDSPNGAVVFGFGYSISLSNSGTIPTTLELFDATTKTSITGVGNIGILVYYEGADQTAEGPVVALGGRYTPDGTNWYFQPYPFVYDTNYMNFDNVNLVNPVRELSGVVTLRSKNEGPRRILMAGGRQNAVFSNACDLFTFNSATYTAAAANATDMSFGRYSFNVFALGTGKALAAGGFVDNGSGTAVLTTNMAIFDPEPNGGAGAWTASTQVLPWLGSMRKFTLLPGPDGILNTEDDYVLIVGGLIRPEGATQYDSTAQVYIYKP